MNERQKFIETETEGLFGQLDLSGFPELVKPPLDNFNTPDKNGFSRLVENGSNGLRALAQNPDPDTLARIALETGDENLAAKIREEAEGRIADECVRTHARYYRNDENYQAIVAFLSDRNQPFTLPNLHTAFTELTRTGEMLSLPGVAKPLSSREHLHIISLAKSNQIEAGISQYLDYALPDAERHWQDGTEFLSDVSTLEVRNAAVRFVFVQSQSHVRDTDEFRTFESEFFKRRPLHSFNDYQECHRQFLLSEKMESRKPPFRRRSPGRPRLA